MQEVDDSLDDNLIEVSLDGEMTLPTDRALSYEEALSLRASNISLMNEDYEKLAKLERYAQDPNETNARYVWAEYQTWHSEGSETERAGYKSIYELAKTGHPYACADVYVWSVSYVNKFFRDVLGVSEKDILEIQDYCFSKAAKNNTNEIKQFYIESFFADYGDMNNHFILSSQSMQDADKERVARVKTYLLDYLFYWTNDFYGGVPDNNLAEISKAYQYLQVLAYDPYGFDAIEACAWHKYFKEDIVPYVKAHDLPDTIVWRDNLDPLMSDIERKLDKTQFEQAQCQNRYLEVRDSPRDSNAKSRNFY